MAALVISPNQSIKKDKDYLPDSEYDNDSDSSQDYFSDGDNDNDSVSSIPSPINHYHDQPLTITKAANTTNTTTKKVKRPKKMHPCPYPDCGKIYTQKPKLTDHLLSHTGEKPFLCPFPGCNKAYRRKGHLTVHCQVHDPKTLRTFRCDQCDQKFNLKHHLKRHEETIHLVPLSFQCDWPDCTAAFTKKYQLRRHMCIHTNKKPHPCPHPGCNASFEYKSRLQYHEDTVHSAIQRYVCTEPDCNSKFTKWSELQTHVNASHPVECQVCHKSFARRALLNRHMKGTHLQTERVPCEHEGCDKTFSSKKALRLHTKNKHDPCPRFKCTFDGCIQTFHFRTYWLKHEQSHKKRKEIDDTLAPIATPPSPSSTTKKAKTTTLIENLTGFSYSNDENRKYTCPFDGCNHKFIHQYDLERHLQSRLHAVDVASFANDAMNNSQNGIDVDNRH